MNQGEPYTFAFLTAVVGTLGSMYSLFYQYNVWHWPYVWGELLNAKMTEFGFRFMEHGAGIRSNYANSVKYSYKVRDQEYEGDRLSAMILITSGGATTKLLEKQMQGIEEKDGKVKVYYNPKRPHKSYLIRGSLAQVVVTSVIFLVMSFALLFILSKKFQFFSH